jgi:DNA-directed RNA polymerase subunit beta'
VLIEGKAIQLHPLVCSAFNADFDGDQMAVHVPLSLEAQLEARVLMMSTNNILHPANGQPIIVPSQDMVLGLYYLSIVAEGEPGEGMIFGNMGELQHALDNGVVTLHTKIKGRFKTVDSEGNAVSQVYDTTPGRMIIANLLPRDHAVPFDIVNTEMTKKNISNMIDQVYRHCGQKETVIFCDQIMQLGFKHACTAGISFGKDDMVIPDTKKKLIEDTQAMAKEFEQQYNDGLITQGEKYNKVVDAWGKVTETVADEMMKEIQAVKFDDNGRQLQMNSVNMMAHSGARGSRNQMKQLAGMRGLMAKPDGSIIETPVISCFKEGLTVMEYFNSTHGARKGLADTALKTANSGYLTRRLVDVAQDCIVNETDCGTDEGLTMTPIVDAGHVVASLGHRVLGRFLMEDVVDKESGEVVIENGTMIEEKHLQVVEDSGMQSLKIRSPLTCATRNGICGKCYGRDLARGTPVNMGEAVGVIAAQSIGEPGTQLTMRTFHIGGTAQVVDQSFTEASFEGTIEIRNRNVVRDSSGSLMVLARNSAIVIKDEKGEERATHRVTYGSKLLVDDGDTVKQGDRLAEWDPYTRPVLTEVGGVVEYEDIVDGVSVAESADESTGITKRVLVDWRANPRGGDLKPALVIRDKKSGEVAKLDRGGEARFMLNVDAILSVEPGQEIHAGDVLARNPTESAKTKDITGGLPRVAELFEARRPKDAAVIAEIDGTVRYGRDYKNKRRIMIEPNDSTLEPAEYLIPKAKPFNLQDGDPIEKGEYLLDGNPAPHDILAIKGVEALASYLVNEIQEVYRLQGVGINDKHIEVIVRQMLQKVEITKAGDSGYVAGEHIDRIEFDELNELLAADKKEQAEGTPVLLGITKASLQTRSFISAASFQETTRVLTEAAVIGKSDTLEGLKENVIVGRLIPAGTGGVMSKVRRVANMRDNLILEERKRSEDEASAAAEALLTDMSSEESGGSEAAEEPAE